MSVNCGNCGTNMAVLSGVFVHHTCEKIPVKEEVSMRYIVVVAEGGLIKWVDPFHRLESAKAVADSIAATLNRADDDVVVMDLHVKDPYSRRVYQPLVKKGGP